MIKAWSSPKPSEPASAPLSGSDPWGSDSAANDNAGWADFSSANFEFDFPDKFGKTKPALQDKKPVVEGDMKVHILLFTIFYDE